MNENFHFVLFLFHEKIYVGNLREKMKWNKIGKGVRWWTWSLVKWVVELDVSQSSFLESSKEMPNADVIQHRSFEDF